MHFRARKNSKENMPMIVASKKTVGKRFFPLLLAMVFVLLSLPESAFAASFSAVVTADTMAVYADSALSRQVGTLAQGEIVAVERYSGGVAYFSYPETGSVGYARTADMEPVSSVSDSVRISVSGARFYREASTSSQYKTLGVGSTVYVLSTSGEWARVARNGLGGYMLVSDLYPSSNSQPEATASPTQGALSGFTIANKDAVVIADTITAYDLPDTGASVVGTLEKGTQVRVTYQNGEWAFFTYQGKSGFTPLCYLLPGLPVTVENTPAIARGQATVYETASTSATRLTTLATGEEVTVIARNNDWACVRTEDNVTGYVALAAVVRKTASAAPTATATPAPTNGFGDSDGVITETIPAVAISNTNVYRSASTSSEIQGVLLTGSEVTVLMRNGTWAYVYRNGKYGFCNLYALQRLDGNNATTEPTSDPLEGYQQANRPGVVVTATSVYAQADTTSEVLGSLSAGESVTVTAHNGEWAYVSRDGSTGFVRLRCLLPDANTIVNTRGGIVTRSSTIYETASTSANVLGTVARGDVLTVLAYSSTWAYVRNERGSEGYMSLSAITPYDEATVSPSPSPSATPSIPIEDGIAATVTTDTLYVYSEASTSSTVLGTLSYGESIVVLDHGDTWALITRDGSSYGYCLLSGITRTSDFENGTPATVTVDSLTVYRSASTSSTALGTLYRGAEVTVLDHNNTWAYITRNGSYGFCLLSGLTPSSQVDDPDDSTVKYVATVVYPQAPFFQSASQDSAYVTVSAGTDVNVYLYDSDTGWGYVGIDNQRGYMLLKHLNKASYSTLSSGSSGGSVLTLQQALEELGYFDGVPAGNYSSLTQTAVSRFQSAVGLSATGTADQTTQRILYGGYAPSSPLLSLTLSNGSTGDNVTRLQTRLYHKGYLSKTSSVDGDYGSTTASAVRLFQSAAGLSATGTADSATLRALYSNNAPKNPSNASDADSGGSGGGDSGSGGTLPDNPTRTEKIEHVIYVAQQQLGKPYVYGATGPSRFDCSGFTTYCYKTVGVTFGRTAQQQGYNAGTKIEGLSNLQRGDIVCMNTVSDSDLSDHVGIYLGDNKMIHASSGAGEVIISDLGSGYYNRVFSWGRRVL